MSFVRSAVMTFFLAASVSAGAQTSAVLVDSACKKSRTDSYDRGWRISADSHSFANQCVKASSVRPAIIERHDEGSVSFANFYHRGKFWKARWSKADQPAVRFLVVHFASGVPGVRAAHTELRFFFPKGLELTSHVGNERAVVKDVIMSWEAVFTDTGKYSFLAGLKDNYPIAGRFLSLQARVPENFPAGTTPRRVDQFDLNLSKAEGAALFADLLRESHRRGYRSFYNTLSMNCTTQLFDGIDRVLAASSGQSSGRFRTILSPDPIVGPSVRALSLRRLIRDTTKNIDLARELGIRR